MITTINKLPNKEGFFGSYGGQFISDDLKKEFVKNSQSRWQETKKKNFC